MLLAQSRRRIAGAAAATAAVVALAAHSVGGAVAEPSDSRTAPGQAEAFHLHLPLSLARAQIPSVLDVGLQLAGQIGGPSYAVATDGEHGFFGLGPHVAVVDLPNPEPPFRSGLPVRHMSPLLGGYPRDIVAHGGTVAVALGSSGTAILSYGADGFVGEPTHLPGDARGLATDGDVLYVAGADGLWSVALADLDAPLRSLDDAPARAVTAVGQSVFVVNDEPPRFAALTVDPITATVNATLTLSAMDIVANDTRAFTAGSSSCADCVTEIDISEPSAPMVIESYPAVPARSVALHDAVVYAVSDHGLSSFPVTEPFAVTRNSRVGGANGVAVGGGLVLVVADADLPDDSGGLEGLPDPPGALHLVDAADIGRSVETLVPPTWVTDLEVAEGTLWATGDPGALPPAIAAIDASGSGTPRLLGWSRLGQPGVPASTVIQPAELAVASGKLFVGTACRDFDCSNELVMLDPSRDPPVRLASSGSLGAPGPLAVSENAAALIEAVFEGSDPTNWTQIVELFSHDAANLRARGKLALEHEPAWAAPLGENVLVGLRNEPGIFAWNAMSPDAPRLIGSVSTASPVVRCAVEDSRVACLTQTSVALVDFDPPHAPKLLFEIPMRLPGHGQGWWPDIKLHQRLIYITDGDMLILDGSERGRGVLASYDGPDYAPGQATLGPIAVDGSRLYVPYYAWEGYFQGILVLTVLRD